MEQLSKRGIIVAGRDHSINFFSIDDDFRKRQSANGRSKYEAV